MSRRTSMATVRAGLSRSFDASAAALGRLSGLATFRDQPVWAEAPPNLSNCLGFSSASVFTHRPRSPYLREPFWAPKLVLQNPRGRMSTSRTIRWVLLIIAVAVVGYYGWQRFGARNAPPAQTAQQNPARNPVPVKIAAVEKADFPVYLTGLGTVQGFNTVLVRTRVDGQINSIAFKEGQFVKQGDTLVEIDPRPFGAALDQAKAKKAQDQANLANANLDLQRFTKLGEFATRQQTDTQRSTVAQLTAQIAADTALIENAQTQLDYATVKAPISGIAGLRQVDVGNIVNAATQTGIVTIAQIEPITVIFTAPEDQLPDIKAALAAGSPKTIALSTDGKRVLSTGTLSLINNQVDTSSGTVRLKAVFDNTDHALWPGQSVSTRLLIATLKDATIVPDDAVQHGPNGLYAYTVNKENKAELRKIKVTR